MSLGIVALVLVFGLAGLAVLHIAHGRDFDLHHNRMFGLVDLLIVQIVAELPLIPYLLIALPRVWRTNLRELGFKNPTSSDVATALLGGVVMIVLVNGIASALVSIFHVHHEEQAVAMLKQMHTPAQLIFFCIIAVVVAPCIEELVFRVFLFGGALRLGAFWTASLISGVAFGAAHGDKIFLFPLALGGIVLCAVYYRTRNAWMSMITHSMFNATSVAGLLLVRHAGL
ncbi:MAG: CPBP family intramembrane metalloprotease [Candidatus Eremiobacteraeota bacterium]|nr:CPBP family intramembrane metalloprotease [Candidatus Eremiobacteraeota bacterium]